MKSEMTTMQATRGLGPVLAAGFIAVSAVVGLIFRLFNIVPDIVREGRWGLLTQVFVLHICLIPLFAGYLYYLIARYGFWRRQLTHSPASREEIENVYLQDAPKLAVLVPAYKEEKRTIRQTMMSAALAEYPCRRVMLLIDDPVNPKTAEDRAGLQAARALPRQLDGRFRLASARFRAALANFEAASSGELDRRERMLHLATLYGRAAQILEIWAEEERAEAIAASGEIDHTDRLFIDRILLAPARAHRQRSDDLAAAEEMPDTDVLRREYRRLAALFDVKFGSFERKRFENLSHVANKAMNLNSYLSVMGKAFREVRRADGCHLEPCDEALATVREPDADYVVVLDADSFIVSDYALRLGHILKQPGNERIALIQTPYIAIPDSPVLIERVASATTDLHYFVQQGVSYFNAAYWVGPNSLIRREALDDIMVESVERGHTVQVFIQDRTVIEDTGSTIDLIRKGWTLHNYFDRLAYSATPADFGALLIQRRRWANGGLILLPALLSYLSQGGRRSVRALVEAYLRIFNLVSPASLTVATLILIFSSFDSRVLGWWLPFIAAPYYVLLTADLLDAGYRRRDLPRVYAMNLMLLPVVLGGTWQSIQQIFTGKKAGFTRTPKIASRTAAPTIYLAACYGIFLFCVLSVFGNIVVKHYYNSAFSLVFATAFCYSLARYITIRAAWEDVVAAQRLRWQSWRANWALQFRPEPKSPALARAPLSVIVNGLEMEQPSRDLVTTASEVAQHSLGGAAYQATGT